MRLSMPLRAEDPCGWSSLNDDIVILPDILSLQRPRIAMVAVTKPDAKGQIRS
jgi:hypothetical protein